LREGALESSGVCPFFGGWGIGLTPLRNLTEPILNLHMIGARGFKETWISLKQEGGNSSEVKKGSQPNLIARI
jgi:hypothetical protein